MIPPTSGDALINGLSLRTEMGAIRRSLGVCPQFDILWPDISVREHLELYAAIKGYKRCGAWLMLMIDSVQSSAVTHRA